MSSDFIFQQLQSHWSSRWSSDGLTTATLCWLNYLSTWSGVFSRF